jgi:hypothetical protein
VGRRRCGVSNVCLIGCVGECEGSVCMTEDQRGTQRTLAARAGLALRRRRRKTCLHRCGRSRDGGNKSNNGDDGETHLEYQVENSVCG